MDWETVGFWGIVIFSIAGSWGLWKQGRKIWKEKSGKSVSVISAYFFMASLLVSLAYGWEKDLDALLIHSLLRIVFLLPIVVGLFKFKTFTKTEKYSCVSLCLVVSSIWFTTQKDFFFLAFQIVGIFALATQPYEIIKNQDIGVVEPKLYKIYSLSSGFWVIYAFATRDLVLEITQPAYFILMVTTLALCLHPRYKKPK